MDRLIKINLLPPQYKKDICILKICDYIPHFIILAGILVIFNLLFAVVLFFENISLAKLEEIWRRKSPDYEFVSSLNKELSKLQTKKKTLEKALSAKVNFSKFMYELYKFLPVNLWFDELSYDSKEVKITGRAVDFNTDAVSSLKEFVEKMKNSEYFSDVNVDSMKKERVKNTDILYFKLTFKND